MPNADQIIDLFNEAKARPAGPERERFLADACGEDAVLREQIVSLIEADTDGRSELLDRGLVRRPAILTTEKIGNRIGRFKLLEKIGEGGCGVVYMAEQEEPVRRRVALKVIKLGMDTKSVVARFEAERQALALMDHPNIAKVFDGGATEAGRPYFVMELVRGTKITDFCDQNSVPIEERLRLFINVCEAIQHAHLKGIIHRDIKPSNILVSSEDGKVVPKVIDFGIAKATEQSLTDKTVFTAFEQFIGTPAYMSPEQAERTNVDIDTRSDIYSLGVLLYELLTGHTPFDSKASIASGVHEVQRVIRESDPPKPSDRLSTLAGAELTTVAGRRLSEPPKLLHQVRGDLDWIAMKCLEKDRARRYQTASGLAADLQRHLANEPVVARPPSKAYQFRKLVRRNKLAFAAGTAIAAALVIGSAIATWMYLRERDARQLAKQRLAEVSAERDAKEVARQEAEAISIFMSEIFDSPNPARDGRTITVAETLDKAAKKLETDLANQPARRATLQATLGNTYQALGLSPQAVPLREKVVEYHRAAAGPEHPKTLSATNNLASCYAEVGRLDEAIKLREEVLPVRRKVLGPEHPDTLWSMHKLAESYVTVGREDAALKLREEVLSLRRKVLGPEHPDTLWAMHSLADSYVTAVRPDEALKLREEVMTLRRKILGSEHPATLSAMHNVAASYFAAGRHDEALKLREELLPLRRKVLGLEHLATLWSMNLLAVSYGHAGRHEEALQLFEEALSLFRKVLGPKQRDTLWTMNNLANSYAMVGRHEEARKLREEALPSSHEVFGPERHTVSTLNELTNAYFQAGRTAEALSMLVEASTRTPEDMALVLRVAALQVWFGQEADHAVTCKRMLEWAADAKPEDVERVVRLTCLRPIDDISMRETTLALARQAVDLGQGTKGHLPRCHMTLGMAEYRCGHYPAADEALTTAAKTASATGPDSGPAVEGIASFYRAMSLFKQGKQAGAREFFTATEAKMKPLPADEKDPLADGKSNHDDLILWLACKEARALLNIPPAGKR